MSGGDENTSPFCLECGSESVREERSLHTYQLKSGAITVENDWHIRCESCGAVSHPGAMMNQSFLAIAERLRQRDELLSPAELKEIRLRFGFLQSDMERLLEVGEKTWLRWERGKVVQSKQYDNQIRRISKDVNYLTELMDQRSVDNETARDVIASAQERSRARVVERLATSRISVPAEFLEEIAETARAAIRAEDKRLFDASPVPDDFSSVIKSFSSRIPVDVDGMALALGIKVYRDPTMSRDASGRIELNATLGGPSGYAIFVNSKEAPVRQRYTIAHEIAHFVSHKQMIGAGLTESLHRKKQKSREEREADAMAATILMPADKIRQDYKEMNDISALAKKYSVSYDAMAIRLEELRLG